MKPIFPLSFTFVLTISLWTAPLSAQENLEYQRPPEEILKLVDVPRPPSVLMDDQKQVMVLLYRPAYKSIEELARKELRLAGLRKGSRSPIPRMQAWKSGCWTWKTMRRGN